MIKGRKGLSPIISVLLLILIAVAAAVIIYAWFSGAASTNPTNTPQLYERIKIEGVQVSSDSKTFTISVRNIGDVALTVDSAYVINATSGSVLCSNTGIGIKLPAKGTDTVTVTCSNSVPSGLYTVKVVTTDGIETTYTFSYVAPS